MNWKINSWSTIALIVLVLFSASFISCSSEKREKRRTITVAFYNVENLFDMENQAGKSDGEFTPEGSKKWTQERYEKKLNELSKVLVSINKKELPEIIGLCEVENKKVLDDLIITESLANGNYNIVHFESPDFRGIDCALLYRPDEFEVIKSFPINVEFKDEPDYSTRDILYVKGKTTNREEMHIFVNHWPSRIGGVEKTEPKRVEVATLLKSKIDSIQKTSKKAKFIVMGDMNDEPSNISLFKVLDAKKPSNTNADFVNIMFPIHEKKEGSYNYRSNWNMLDNIVISSNLLDNKGFQCKENQGFVFHEEWMEFKNKKEEMSPNRTYGGPNYYGGISDHFPVYFQLQR